MQRSNFALGARRRWFLHFSYHFRAFHQPTPTQVEVNQHLNVLEFQFGIGRGPSVVSQALEPRRQRVLQESAYELLPADRAGLAGLTAAGRIAERDAGLVDGHDSFVANRDSVDVRSQVLERRLAAGDRLHVNRPWRVPRFGIGLLERLLQSRRSHRVSELAGVDFGSSFLRKQKVLRSRQPLRSVS